MNALSILWFSGLVLSSLPAQDWPGFRGRLGDGVATAKGVPKVWSSEKNVRWKVALKGPGNGSPVVEGDAVLLAVTELSDGKRRGLYCFDRRDGKQRWSRSVAFARQMPTHKANPYCGSTPATDGQRVVVWHGSAGLHCYDLEGKPLWSRELGEFRHRWGYGTSPVLLDGKVILHSGPGRRVFVIAVELATGKTVWRTAEPVPGDGQDNAEGRMMGSWCTPVVIEHDGRKQILCSMPTRLVAYDPDDGKILWWCRGLSGKRGDLVYSSPVVVGDICSVLAGYEGPELGIRLGGKGDVTETHRLWRHDHRPSNVGSGVAVDGKIYLPDERGFLVCLEPKTGERLWSARPAKGRIWGSVVSADGRLYALNQRGTTIVFAADPKQLRVLALNELGERTNSTPVVVGSEVFLRTYKHLYCIAAQE